MEFGYLMLADVPVPSVVALVPVPARVVTVLWKKGCKGGAGGVAGGGGGGVAAMRICM